MAKEQIREAEKYLYSVGWSDEDDAFIARVAEFPSLATHGATPESALAEARDLVGFVLTDLRQNREMVPEPLGKRTFSGRLVLRMPRDLHRTLALEAAQQGVSLNQLLNLKLGQV
jgi:predicted RNase H-like HicB family nuclease